MSGREIKGYGEREGEKGLGCIEKETERAFERKERGRKGDI